MSVNAYLSVYGFQILCEISKVTFDITHKIWNPYTAKCAFYEVLKNVRKMLSYSYGILCLTETAPRNPINWYTTRWETEKAA